MHQLTIVAIPTIAVKILLKFIAFLFSLEKKFTLPPVKSGCEKTIETNKRSKKRQPKYIYLQVHILWM